MTAPQRLSPAEYRAALTRLEWAILGREITLAFEAMWFVDDLGQGRRDLAELRAALEVAKRWAP